MSGTGLTVCMIVRDERRNVAELLPAIRPSVDEVIVVDTGSVDGTPAVAEGAGARVVHRAWDDDFAAARNAGLACVTTSHALWLDADDRIAPEDLGRVREAVRKRPGVAWMMLLVNEAEDPSAVTSCWQLRVFPARTEHRFAGRVHEQIQEALRRTGTPIERLDATVRHTGYTDPEEVLRKSRRNLALSEKELAEGRPDDVNVLYHLMRAAARCGEPAKAIDAARRLVERPAAGAPTEVLQTADVTLGRLLFQRGQTRDALAVLRRAVERAPEDPLARYYLGDLLRRDGDLISAARELAAARACPIRFETVPVPVAGLSRAIRTTLGEVLEHLARPAEAAAAYREALRDFPGDGPLARMLARACIAMGELDEAGRILDGLADNDDAVPEMLRLRGGLAFSRGRDVEAKRLFERVETLCPRDGSAPLHLGHLALRAGDFAGATKHYERALAGAETPEARVGLAAAQLELNLVPACLESLVRAVEGCPGRPLPPGTEALLGEALLRSGRAEEAREAFERHLRRFGADARVLARLADCYRALGAPAAARRGYEEALRMRPGLVEAESGLVALTGAGSSPAPR
ncbi:MAG: tetratricopeptide repeat protein [bacterium]